nr:PhF00086.1 [Neoporphyra haitanensis]
MPPPPGDLPAPLAAFLPPTPLRSAASGRARRPDPRLARRVQQRPSMAAGPSARPPPPPPPRRSAPRGRGGGGGGGVAALAAGIVALAAATSGGGGGGVGMAALPLPPAARAEVAVAGSASAGGGGGGGGGVDAAMPLAASMVRGGSALDAAEAAMGAADAAVAAAEAATSAADAATVAADAAMAAAASVPAAAERAGVHARVATAAAVPEPTSVITPSGSAPDPTAVTVPSAGGLEPTAVARPDAAPGAAPAAVPTMVDSIPSRSPAPDYISPSLAPPPVTPAVATAPAPTSPAPDKEHALLEEVWSLIDRYYLTLRDAPAWADQRRKAASTPLGGSRTATYAAARRMLKTLGDPYTRLLTPDGMAALSKYDVTGLGLMLLPTKGGGADADAAAPPPVAAAAAANSGSKAVSGSSGSGGSSDGAAAAPSRLYVAAPPPKDSPAGVAGLRRSDVIMAIDGKSTANMSAWEAATRMQGPAEGLLSISYARPPAVAPGATPALGAKASAAAPSADAAPSAAAPAPPPPDTPTTTVSLTRKFASASAVTSTLLPPAASLTAPIVGVVRLSEFNASAAADAGAAFQRLAAAGADAYVLDLRGNPGGVFEGALDLAGLLDGDGTPAATVVDKTGASETFTGHVVGYEAPVSPVAQEQTAPTGRRGGGLTGRALPANAVPTGAVAASAAVPPGRGVVVPLSAPLVVLLDDHSASSSEVLAGALRDNCRAVLAGGRSYGKGVIQGVFGLSDGAGLVVTVASYVTPRGDVIQERGLSPQLPLSAGLKERAGAALRGRPPPLEEKIDWARVREQLSLCAAGEEDVVGDGRGGGVGHTPWGGGGRAHGAF